MDGIKDDIYKILRESNAKNIAPTVKYIQSKISCEHLQNIKTDIISLLGCDENIVKINSKQYILKEEFEKIINDSDSKESVLNYFKNKYFLQDLNEDLIRDLFKSEAETAITSIVSDYSEIDDIEEDYESFVKEIISTGYITYKELSDKLKLYGKDYDEVSIELDSSGVKLLSDHESEVFEVNNKNYSIKKEWPVNKSSYREQEKTEDKNILLVDLRINELISIIFIISYMHFNGKENIELSRKHLREMTRFKLISENNEGVDITNIGKKLSENFYEYLRIECDEKFSTESFKDYKTSDQLSKSRDIKEIAEDDKVWNYISSPLRENYRSNKISQSFLEFLKEANSQNHFTMKDLYLFAINNNYDYILNNILIGDRATSGLKAIKKRTDICFDCQLDKCNKSQIDLEGNLMYYREHYVNKIISSYKGKKEIGEIIKKDPLLIKYMVPYNFTSKNKDLFKKISLIEDDNTIHKKDGMYCINLDKWRINDGR